MAPAEISATPEQPESSQVDDNRETAQKSPTDPSTSHPQQTDPAMAETLRGSTSSLDEILEKLSKPTPVNDKQK
ncbi:uncharacterized protein RAG0_12618 [Rhynchosporium agropyri]|uniref:Uncharacterized protein n=2 Tax=Rhynchosporium TaxID=38037 RepID=A0A1E1MUF2_RHYSE|nr:uncharacterized protein RAG0_12618 [Rhynchosporium agropyri]CZT52683.1 uncharacterized protein RSE6_14038 [Rhynchosporium secalis]